MNDLDIKEIRKDFPLLNNSKLAYLDNAATSQKPECVLNAEKEFYEKYNANPFRGLYDLSEDATKCYEDARVTVGKFINANSEREIVFTRNATESLNLVANSLSQLVVKPGDEILVSIMEHHSNLLVWQQAALRCNAKIKYIECEKDGTLTEDIIKTYITDKTKILALTQVSNVFGRENDIKSIAKMCHNLGIIIVVDGAQSVPHMKVDVQELDVDFLAFSGHKMLAPMGIGGLYGKIEWLEKMPPFLFGGEMIEYVTLEGATYAEVPHKFEAGTVNAAGAYALAKAIDYIKEIGFENMIAREEALCELAMDEMKKLPYINIIGSQNANEHNGIITFTIDGVHPHDVASILGNDNIAVRAGHHCAQPLLKYLGTMSTTRASIMFYNTENEIQMFIDSLKQIRRKMGYYE